MNYKKILLKIWEYLKLAKFELIVLASIVFIDLVSKSIVDATMDLNDVTTIIPNLFNFNYVHNYKAAFGYAFGLEKIIGDDGIRIIFLIITIIAVGVFCFFMFKYRGKHLLVRLSFALIISGALGNFFDRLFLGYVRDFMEIVFLGCDIPLLGSSFAIFNIADMALVAGVIIFAVYFLIIYKEPKKVAAEVTGTSLILEDKSAKIAENDKVNLEVEENTDLEQNQKEDKTNKEDENE